MSLVGESGTSGIDCSMSAPSSTAGIHQADGYVSLVTADGLNFTRRAYAGKRANVN
jgi:hypothetical protein